MTTTSVTSHEAIPAKTIMLELRAQEWNLLRTEHERLSRGANPALAWDSFLQTCITIGVERLQRIPTADALNLVGLLDGGRMHLFRQIMTASPAEPEKRVEAIEPVDRLEG